MTGVADHASRLGLFERVNMHEPKNAPGNGLTAVVWVQDIGPIAARSGLSASSARVLMNVRVYVPMLAESQDLTDPNLVAAVDALLTAYSGDFDLGGRISNVDLLGAHGIPLQAQAGYLEQDRKHYRVMTITVPLIVNDAWEQVP